jgi:drug/metabolite transporter (DMT)-like permease
MASRASIISWMICAAVAFTTMAAFVRQLSTSLNGLEIVFYRSLFHLVIVLILVVRARKNPFRELTAAVLIRSLLGFVAVTCFFFSVGALEVGFATLIQFTAPAFTLLFAALFLGERVMPRHWILFGLAFVGIALASGAGSAFVSKRACVISLIGACAGGFSYGFLKRSAKKTSESSLAFWFSLVALVGSFAATGTEIHLPAPSLLPSLIAVGLSVALYQFAVTRAYQSASATRVAPLSLLPSVLGPFVQGMTVGLWPSGAQWGGTALTVCSIALLNVGKKQ